jgi:hypothetical protein
MRVLVEDSRLATEEEGRHRRDKVSDFSIVLFARPSLAEGVGRILDFRNSLNEYNRCLTPWQADRVAIYCDWHRVGLDISESIRATHCHVPQASQKRL